MLENFEEEQKFKVNIVRLVNLELKYKFEI